MGRLNKNTNRAERDLFEERMERIKQATGTRTQVQLAEALGVRQSSISDAKRRASIPDGWLLKLAMERQCNPSYILHGAKGGSPFLMASDADGEVVDAAQLRVEITAQVRAEVDNLTTEQLLERLRAAMPGHAFVPVPDGWEVKMRPVGPIEQMGQAIAPLDLPRNADPRTAKIMALRTGTGQVPDRADHVTSRAQG